MSESLDIDFCPRCGAPVDGEGACFALLTELNAKEYSDPDYGRAGHYSADAHALQHPEDHEPDTIVFHLVRLAWLLEFGGNPSVGSGADWLDKKKKQLAQDAPDLHPPPPMDRGDITVVALAQAAIGPEHVHLARQWAKAVWRAWSDHQPWARRWVIANQPKD